MKCETATLEMLPTVRGLPFSNIVTIELYMCCQHLSKLHTSLGGELCTSDMWGNNTQQVTFIITHYQQATSVFQPVIVCVCDSCRERTSAFPFSCVTIFPFSVRSTSCDISWLGSSSFSSGVLWKPSSCEDSGMLPEVQYSSSTGSVGVVMSPVASFRGSWVSPRQDSTQPFKIKMALKCCGNGRKSWVKFYEFKATVLVSYGV